MRYSPIIEPIHAIPTFILRQETNVGIAPGNTSLVSICHFFAPSDCINIILPFSVARNPFCIVMVVTIIVIIIAIKTMDFTPLPNHTIIIGPKAIFGKELRTMM